jgi:predicted RNA-binding Zn ribbon-like protein
MAKEKEHTQILVRLPAELHDWLRNEAERDDVSMTAIAIEGIELARGMRASRRPSSLRECVQTLLAAVNSRTQDPRWDALLALLNHLTPYHMPELVAAVTVRNTKR